VRSLVGTAKPEHVAQVLTALGVVGEPYNEIMALARDIDAPLWIATTLPAQRQQLAAFVDAEQNATSIVEVSPLLVPGLLQTTDYIRAIMSGGGMPPDEAVTRMAIRVGRRAAITRPNPVEFTTFIGQGALHQLIGSPAIMLEQLRHLRTVAKRPNVTIRVTPFGSGWHPALEGAFTLIRSDGAVPIVLLENRSSGLFLHEDDDVTAYEDAVELVAEAALSPIASIELIAKMVAEKER
jgi:hypothetical protein